MLDWIKRRVATTYQPREVEVAEVPKPRGRAMSGKYLLLYKYLEGRYANTVVLTLSEIEDLLGFSLPDQARLEQEWWTTSVAGPSYSDAWILASRTARPNLMAKTVIFERTS
jgi:hypothetical protein